MDIILGNISSIGAMICDSFSGTRKTKRGILVVQCFSQLFYILSSVILKGYSATVQNAVAIFRNLFAAYGKKNKPVEYILIILPVILGFIFNNRGLMGVLPILANLEYSVAVFAFGDRPKMIRLALVLNCLMFCIFNFAILNMVSGVACIVTALTTSIALYKERKDEKESKNEI